MSRERMGPEILFAPDRGGGEGLGLDFIPLLRNKGITGERVLPFLFTEIWRLHNGNVKFKEFELALRKLQNAELITQEDGEKVETYVWILSEAAKFSAKYGRIDDRVNTPYLNKYDRLVDIRLREIGILTGSKGVTELLREEIYPYFDELESLIGELKDSNGSIYRLRNEVKGASLSLLAELFFRGSMYGRLLRGEGVERVRYEAGKILFGFLYPAMLCRGIYEDKVRMQDRNADNLANYFPVIEFFERNGDRQEIREIVDLERGKRWEVVIIEPPVKSFMHFLMKSILSNKNPEEIWDVHRRSVIGVGWLDNDGEFHELDELDLPTRVSYFRRMVMMFLRRAREAGLRFAELDEGETIIDNTNPRRIARIGKSGNNSASNAALFLWIKGLLIGRNKRSRSIEEVSEIAFWVSRDNVGHWLGFEEKEKDDRDYLKRKIKKIIDWLYPDWIYLKQDSGKMEG